MADVNDNPFLDDSNPFMDINIRKHKQSSFNEMQDALHGSNEDDFLNNNRDVSYYNIHRDDYKNATIRKKKQHRFKLIVALVATIIIGLAISYGANTLQRQAKMYNIQAPAPSASMKGNFRGQKCNIDGNSCSSDNNGNTVN
jgi:F0F1-type ATP synthase assembly protein I